MKISLNWIRDYVDLTDVNINDLLNQFTLSVAEIEGVEHMGKELSGIVAAKIVSLENHPNSKKLHVLKVDTGKPELTDVVCGAPNCRLGMVVPFATMGANVNGFVIGKAMLAGMESCGMCCSGKELGVSDNHDGLLELPENTVLGTDIKDLLPIEDTVFEVDNKSLTNRPDLWGHYGIAREIAALLNRPLKPVELDKLETYNNLPELNIAVNSPDCYRYSSIAMNNITQKQSNLTTQIRLHYAGMRPINLLTDLTNYLMLELGQPMHAFDHALVNNIQVLNLAKPTQFTTLDGVNRELPANTLVIASNNVPVAVAGVMGGEQSGIQASTNSVLLESANFDATVIRKTAINLGLRSESSARYEKTLDPELTEKALARYVHLLKQHDAGVKVTSRFTDRYVRHYEPVTVELTKAYLDRYIGISIPEETVLSILKRLGFGVKVLENGTYHIAVPSWRATKDVKLPCDIVEEVTRIYGYDNIIPHSTTVQVAPQRTNFVADMEYRVKLALASNFRWHEVHSQIWYDAAVNQELGIEPKSVVKLVNALQKENSQIRQTMVPSLLKFVLTNKNQTDEFGLFEVGRVASGLNPDGTAKEERHLGIVLYSKTNQDAKLLLQLKQALEFVVNQEFNLPFEVLPKTPSVAYYHPVNNYAVVANGKEVGEIALLHPTVKNNILNTCSVVVAEINLSQVFEQKPQQVKFQKVTKFPVSEFDFSFVVPTNYLYSQLLSIAKTVPAALPFSVTYVDVFQPTESEKVITIKTKVWSNDHTLTSEELDTFYNSFLSTFEQNNIFIKTI